MKSSGLFTYTPPAKLVSDYTEAEKAAFQAQFKSRAGTYRYFQCYVMGFLLIVTVITVTLTQPRDRDRVSWFLMLGYFCISVVIYQRFKPRCPACGKDVYGAVKSFCPECDNRIISPEGIFRQAKCCDCDKILGRNIVGRPNYKTRYCTHCGILLDKKGIGRLKGSVRAVAARRRRPRLKDEL